MCLKRFNWRQYMCSVLLLIVVFASNTNQQRVISTPQPFRYVRTVGENKNHFVPIKQPTSPKPSDPSVGDVPRTEGPNTKSITTTTTTIRPQIENSVATNKNGEVRNINISIRELQNLLTDMIIIETNDKGIQKRSIDVGSFITDMLFNGKLFTRIQKFAERYIFPVADTAALKSLVPTGARLFLFKGLKKWFGPIFIGVQIAKTVLLAMFLPSIIGSIGKMVGKGLVSSSGFGHPSETVEDFEFKDNPPVDEAPATTGMGYNYQQHHAITANHGNVEQHAYDTAPAANNMLSLYDIAEPKPQFTMANTYPMPEYQQHNTRRETLQSKKDDFKVFHDIPASSMLLTNYDPFYSPLLSRLDAVFHQLNLDGDNEACREKLVCLMYASPARYMPYSNLVSAQLSRELNELRKPTSDNVEILRFFKYMRAARDGQDGKNCHNIHKKCSSFTDTEQPAMLTTYNDINKLVHARNMQ